MALRFLDSTDHYDTAHIYQKYSSGTGATIVTSGGPWGASSQYLRFTGFTTSVVRNLDLQTTWIVGIRYRATQLSVSDNADILIILRNGATKLSLHQDGSGTIGVNLLGTTRLATSTQLVSQNAWHYLELQTTLDPTNGSYKVRLDGNVMTGLPDQTGIQTSDGTNANQVGFQGYGTGTPNAITHMRDIYVLDGTAGLNSLLGDVRVQALLPNANGNTDQFTPTPGANANYVNVSDNPPDDDTTYNASTTAGQRDGFKLPALAGNLPVIKGAQHVMFGRKDDASARSLVAYSRHAGVDYLSAAVQTLIASYQFYLDPKENNPGTGTAWTTGDLTADDFGYDLNA